MSRHHRVYSDRETTTISTVHGIDVTRPAEGHYRTKLRGRGRLASVSASGTARRSIP